jgi:hypothetical protein
VGITDGTGFTSVDKSANPDLIVYKDGLTIETLNNSGLTFGNYTLTACARNYGGGLVSSYSTANVAAVAFGTSLTAAQHLALKNALSAYLTTVGAI